MEYLKICLLVVVVDGESVYLRWAKTRGKGAMIKKGAGESVLG